jgi:hypothetical protein
MWQNHQRVLARRGDEDHWYPGTIRHTDSERFYVIFDDGEDGFATAGQLRELHVDVGARVGVRAPAGRAYEAARVNRVDGDKFHVTYHGGEEEWTSLGMIRVEQSATAGQAGAAPDHFWILGDRVLAKWSGDSFWYPATIQDIDNERYHVFYDDGESDWCDPDEVSAIELPVGGRVFARWQEGPFYYPGRITRVEDERIHVKYDDGEEEWTTLQMIRLRRGNDPMPWKLGQRVLAHWAPEPFFYPAKIHAIKEDYLHVLFDDGDQAWVMPEQIRELRIDVGTRVFARWQGGPYYYPADVAEQRGDRIFVRYDDGRQEWSSIKLVRVLLSDLPTV